MPSYFSINLHINILDENTEKKSNNNAWKTKRIIDMV